MSAPARWSRRRVVAVIGCALLLHLVLKGYVVRFTEIRSGSMGPTLEGEQDGGDVVLVDILSPRLRDPRRGECVAFHNLQGLPIIKRVAGLPGEDLRLVDGRLHVDGEPRLPDRDYLPKGFLREGGHAMVMRGRYFVLGDDTRDSYDSRYHGAIARDEIYGIARFVVWPPSRFGPVR